LTGATLAAAVLTATPLSLGAKTAVPVGVTVDITVTNLRNAKGTVWACMTTQADAFPKCDGDAKSYRTSAPAHDAIELRFDDVKPGTYAIALMHDENGNGKIDKTLILPREGFGFSRDAAVKMGPPSFSAAAFAVGAQPVHQIIKMRYLL
tara:strand:- start:430 stop:879 length:450 start_codon:yes stop_codon:yes gene_type:complete